MNSSRVLITILVLGAAVAGCDSRSSAQPGAGPVVLGNATYAGPLTATLTRAQLLPLAQSSTLRAEPGLLNKFG